MNARRRFAFPLTLLLGATAVVLGYIGYSDAEPGLSSADSAYRAVQLLTLEYAPPASSQWELELARWLAALALGMALISVIAALTREQADRIRIRTFARGHVVVAGLGERGVAVAAALEEAGAPVVAIENDEAAKQRVPGRARDLAIVAGDPRDTRSYIDAAAARAAHVFVAPGDDSVNLQALEACLAAIGERGPSVHVAIDGQLLWRELHRSALRWSGAGGTIEFISLPDRVGARLVHEAAAELRHGRVIIWGSGPKAVRTAVHAVRWALLDGIDPQVLLVGPHAATLDRELHESEPWLFDCAAVSEEEVPVGEAPGAAFVVGLPHADVLAGASVLAEALDRTMIVAEVPRADGVAALERSGFRADRVHLVDAEPQVLGAALFEGSARELIARGKHADYVARDEERGVSSADNESLRPWEELPESLRQSNRRFAESVGRRLSDLGADLEPLAGPAPEAGELMSKELIEELAQVEHDRWMDDLVADGWLPTDGPKDPERKLHPLLVPWEQLGEDDREKDRDAIRVLPVVLARIGYEIRTDGSRPAQSYSTAS